MMDGGLSGKRNWRVDGTTLTVRVPLRFHRRGGRKFVVAAKGADAWAPAASRPNETLVRALGRAHRWKRLLEGSTYGTIAELAAAEKINLAYVSRVLQLTLLAPEFVEKILDGGLDRCISLTDFLGGFPIRWSEQRERIKGLSSSP